MDAKITLFKEPVAQVLGKQSEILFEYPAYKIWNPKGVSLQRRILGETGFKKIVSRALKPANLASYLVKADSQAPTRCIDGRILESWNDITDLQTRPLGPKVAGGTAHAALAHRIVDVDHLRKNLLFEHDIKNAIHRFQAAGIGFGGHIDDHQKGSNTGCGAVDNIDLILDRLQLPEPQEQLRGLTKMILGDAYNGRVIVNEVIGRMLQLDALKPRYMPKEHNNPDGEYLYKKTIVELIRKEADKEDNWVPALSGEHNEVALVLNFNPFTTFDTDRFSSDNDNKVQVFGWDVWQMFEEAQRLYPYNMHHSPEEQRLEIENRLKYLTTRTLLGVATLMVLTDGSLRLVTIDDATAK